MSIKVINGNCLEMLNQLPEQSVNTCVTSPPYWGLRDYGTAEWEGGDENCDHTINDGTFDPKKGIEVERPIRGVDKNFCIKCGAVRKDSQLGLEETPEEYVENMVAVFREVKRVLRDDGNVWLNLGDSYSSQPAGNKKPSGFSQTRPSRKKHGKGTETVDLPKKRNLGISVKPKDLVGIPWMVAFALRADGWYLRQDIIWHKPNPMPESVTDRCTKSHEYIFLLSKNKKYYYDNEVIKEDSIDPESLTGRRPRNAAQMFHHDAKNYKFSGSVNEDGTLGDVGKVYNKRNKRSVWTITTKPYKEAHFATYPPDLIEPCILAGCPEEVCVKCETPYERKVESKRLKRNELPKDDPRYRPNTYEGSYKDINGKADAGYTETKDLGLEKQCQCESNETKAGTVLDPFGGAGTTGLVAQQHNRNAVLIELNPEYAEMAKNRIYNDAPLFADVR